MMELSRKMRSARTLEVGAPGKDVRNVCVLGSALKPAKGEVKTEDVSQDASKGLASE